MTVREFVKSNIEKELFSGVDRNKKDPIFLLGKKYHMVITCSLNPDDKLEDFDLDEIYAIGCLTANKGILIRCLVTNQTKYYTFNYYQVLLEEYLRDILLEKKEWDASKLCGIYEDGIDEFLSDCFTSIGEWIGGHAVLPDGSFWDKIETCFRNSVIANSDIQSFKMPLIKEILYNIYGESRVIVDNYHEVLDLFRNFEDSIESRKIVLIKEK